MNAGKRNARVCHPAASASSGIPIAHIHQTFFPKSETFIYHAVVNLRRYRPFFVAWAFENLDQFVLDHGQCFSLTAQKWTLPWLRQGLARRLLKREFLAEQFLKQRGVCLLHAHFGPNGVWALPLKHALHIPLITTFYGYDVSKTELITSSREDYLRLFQEGDLFLVEGPHMKTRLMEIGCPEQKIVLQHIAIPASHLPFRNRYPKRQGNRVIFVFSGRFVEKKGLIPALRALSRVHQKHPVFEVRIIGDGPLRADIEECIRTMGMASYVSLLGFLRYDEYMEQMKNADILLQPSVTAMDGDTEGGAPTCILEAQALGMPVISTTHADIPHVVVPGESALLSKEGDWAGLEANVIRLIEEQALWSRMGEIGRRHVESSHDVAREIQKLERVYDNLIDRQ